MHDPYQALRFPNFRLFIIAKICFTMLIQIEMVVVGWQMYQITHDPLSLGLMGLAEVIPALTVSLYAGWVADIYNRRHIVRICYAIIVLSVLGLVYFTKNQNDFVTHYGVLPIYLVLAVQGLARGFASPASFSLLSQLVPKEAYVNSASWNSTSWEISTIIGPVIGGFLYRFGADSAYLLAASLGVMGVIGISLIPNQTTVKNVEKNGKSETNGKESIFTSIKEGINFVFGHKIMLGAITLDLFAVLFGGSVALLPIFADDILHINAEGLGLLRAAPSIGAGLTALVLAYLPPMRSAGRNLLWAVAAFGLATIGFALSQNLYLSLFFLFLIGASDNVSVVIRTTIMQLYTPDEMRGRVSSVNSMFIASSNEIGSFESGFAARYLGTVLSVVFGGCMTLGIVAFSYFKMPVLRTLNFKEKETVS
jgi:MFS family permease